MSKIIPKHTTSSSSCSYSSHSTIDNTSTLKDTQKCKSKQDLWHIIEKQQAIIQELQHALAHVTSERDDLLLKTNKPIPTPPPRSPYRSNNHGETTPENNYTQKRKSIPSTTTTTTGNSSSTQSKAHIKIKSVDSNTFSLAVMDHANLELWAIEKTFTDLIHLNHTLHKKLQLSFHLALDSVDRRQLKCMMEDFFTQALLCQGDVSPVYAFISMKSSKQHHQQQQGYLSKRGKHIIGGWKSYYFILFESELRYFSTHKGDLHVRCIQLNQATQIGKQANDNVEPLEHAFVIVQESAPIILGACSDTERDQWVQALLLATKKRRTPIPRLRSELVTARSSSISNHHHHYKSMYIEQHVPLQDNTRSSMDDQAILNYYESVHQQSNQPTLQRTVVLKASADSLPLDLQQQSNDKSNKKHRKSFWSRRKFFNTTTTTTTATVPIVDTAANIRHTLSFPFINNTEETSSSGSSACSTPMFQIFGVPLEAAIRVSRISERYQLPAIVYRCIAYLEEKNAVHEEGIYRLSGSSVQISHLRQQFCEYGDVDLLDDKKYLDVDVHVVAGLLKAWLRELPINVLTNELLNDFLLICEIKDKQSKIQELGLLVSILPLANYTLLRTLIAHLIHIVHNADINKMTLRNVGIVFAPTLSIPSGIFTLLMSEFEYIFYTKEQQETVVPETTTSADRIKNNYLKKRSNRNSRDYKDQVPPNIINLEKEYRHDSLVMEQDELDDNCNKQMT